MVFQRYHERSVVCTSSWIISSHVVHVLVSANSDCANSDWIMASKRNRPNNSPPVKDGKKKKDLEVHYPCVTCGKEVESECTECEWWYDWEHKDCVGLSNDVYKILDSAPSNVMFFCMKCEPKVKLQTKFQHHLISLTHLHIY